MLGRQPLRQTSSFSAVPLSASTPSLLDVVGASAAVPVRPHSTSPTPPVNIFAVPVTPLSPLFGRKKTPPPTLAQLQSSARILPGASSSSTGAPHPASDGPSSVSGPPMFATAKDLTLDEDPFAPSSAATVKPSHASPNARSLLSSASSSSSDDDESFPYAHQLPARDVHTSPYPGGQPSPSSAWRHRHQSSLPQDFVFASPISSSAASSPAGSASTARDANATLPTGSSPPPPPSRSSALDALPKRRFSRSASQPIQSNVLRRPPAFNTFVPSLPAYHEAVPPVSSGTQAAPAPSQTDVGAPAACEQPSTTNGFSSRPPGARTTSLTMQLAQKEALEEMGEGASSSTPPASAPEEEHDAHDQSASAVNATPDDERRDILVSSRPGFHPFLGCPDPRCCVPSPSQTRPLGLLALSQALSAANDEVDTLRSMVRDTTGLLVDQAYWVAQASQAAAAAAAAAAVPPVPSYDDLTEREVDEMSGSQAREALKVRSAGRPSSLMAAVHADRLCAPTAPQILAATTTKSLAAISCVRSLHALVHSPPGSEAVSEPDDADVFSHENLAMLEGTFVAWGRMARMYQQQQALGAGRRAR